MKNSVRITKVNMRCRLLTMLLPASLLVTSLSSWAKGPVGSYNRKDWPHWSHKNHNCLDTRHEILKARSLVPATVVKCKVKVGKWDDFYFNETLSDPKLIDIDHLVPLKHAFEHGGAAWTREQKTAFANDELNLAITSRHANRQKGANDFTTWHPIDHNYACKYMKQWFAVKEKYALTIDPVEIENKKTLACPE